MSLPLLSPMVIPADNILSDFAAASYTSRHALGMAAVMLSEVTKSNLSGSLIQSRLQLAVSFLLLRCLSFFSLLVLRGVSFGVAFAVFAHHAMNIPSPRVSPGRKRYTGLSNPLSSEPVIFQLSSMSTGSSSAPALRLYILCFLRLLWC